jgi:hypothetical protein
MTLKSDPIGGKYYMLTCDVSQLTEKAHMFENIRVLIMVIKDKRKAIRGRRLVSEL